MTDLLEVLPHFDVTPFRHLIHSLEKNDITVSDLVSLDPIDIARRCPLPLSDLKGLIHSIVRSCQNDVRQRKANSTTKFTTAILLNRPSSVANVPTVRTLDERVDACIGGGLRIGCVTEIVGESAVGKTQFALTLLLSVQLPQPSGLGKSAIYLSTEAPLNTGRLLQMLAAHPVYQSLPAEHQPTLDKIHTISTTNLEMQDHIVRYQLPLAIKRFEVGLIVVDSVAANFRAERETKTAEGLADRAAELMRLGTLLRQLATEFQVAIVTINQVSDRFGDTKQSVDRVGIHPMSLSSPPSSSYYQTQPSPDTTYTNPKLSLDHQQKFFTGWGSFPSRYPEQPKNPALGFAWANQLNARIVLKMDRERGTFASGNPISADQPKQPKRRRYVGVVFAPWTAPSLKLVQYEIQAQGPVSVEDSANNSRSSNEHSALLDPNLWYDGAADEEFP